MEKIIISDSVEKTFEAGYSLGRDAKGGQVYAFYGDLGSGKTVFSKGFAKALGVEQQITSPTFTILKQYNGISLDLYHFDMYRIAARDLEDTGYFEILDDKKAITLIEWAENIEYDLPESTIKISISGNGLEKRTIKIVFPE